MKKLIGTNYFNYPQLRNFVGLSFKHHEFIIVKDIFKLITNIAFKFTKKIYFPLQFLFYSLRDGQVKLYHFFNTISLNDRSWVVTFETTLPRLGAAPNWLYTMAAKRLAHESCKKIIAISSCTAKLQEAYLLDHYPLLADSILRKMIVLHPPQSLLIDFTFQKNYNENIIFSLIGSDFFRKGGKEVLQVFDELISNGYRVQLNIVSSLQYGDYASCSTKDDYLYAANVIKKHKKNIIHFETLSNDKVLKLLRNSHIGLLPTYADTYGYSVLEAQAAGCPVISTDIRALPEINNDNCGWIIKVPKDEMGNAILASREDREILSDTIRAGLFNIVTNIYNDISLVKHKSKLALQRIKDDHDPSVNAKLLQSLYDEALH